MTAEGPDSSEREERWSAVLVACLEALENGRQPDPEELRARYPEFAAELAEFFAHRAHLDRLAAPLRPVAQAASQVTPPGMQPPTLGSETDASPEGPRRHFGDYELLAEIARGGMGVVYRAHQVSLNRTVALKMILAGNLASPADVQRFHSEAEAAAHLDHPHIVSIYEVGERDGQHYFSMKVIEGGSLAQHVGRFPPEPRAAARLLATVAAAVHHAHQHGILHRDLKPGNILLDANGQPHVTDFGLARRLAADKGLTQSGAIVGTPSYVAPEQMADTKRALTTAADVYALGAILYELLTGRPPFQGATPLDTLLQARDQEPERPRALNSRVDRDLETICLKCLQKDPRKRYGSAEALAQDLERWLAGEPIRARRSSAGERLVKWVRRRPASAALAAVSGLAAVGLLLGAWGHTAQMRVALREAQAAREEADRQRVRADATARGLVRSVQTAEAQQQRARENLEKALDAVDKMLAEVGERRLANVPQMEPVRRRLLEDALALCTGLLQENSTEPAARRGMGLAYRRMGTIYSLLGRDDEAEKYYRSALTIQQELVAVFPSEEAYGEELAATQTNLGILLRRRKQPAEVEKLFRQALEFYSKLSARAPDVPGYRAGLARGYHNLATLLGDARRHPEAEELYRKAIALHGQLVKELPTRPGYQHDLAGHHVNLGSLLARTDRLREAEESYRQALTLREKLIQSWSQRAPYREGLGYTYRCLGHLLAGQHSPEARKAYGQAVSLGEKLAADFPKVPAYRSQLADTYAELARFLRDGHRIPEAVDCYKKARVWREKLVAEFPAEPAFQQGLEAVQQQLDLLLPEREKLEPRRLGQERAVRDQEAVVETEPRNARQHATLRGCYGALAATLVAMREQAAAEQVFRQAVAFAEKLVADFPGEPEPRATLGAVLHDLAQGVALRGQLEEARRLYLRACESQQAALKNSPQHATCRASLSNHLKSLAETELKLRRHADAAARAAAYARLLPDRPADVYAAAGVLARCIPLAEQDPQLPEAKQQELARAYGDRAVPLLREVLQKGYKSPGHLPNDPNLEALWFEDRFVRLAGELGIDDWTLRHTRGRLLARRDRWEEVVAEYAKLLQALPQDGAAWLGRSLAHAQLGRRGDAAADYARAVEFSGTVPTRADTWWQARHQRRLQANAEHWRAVAADCTSALDRGATDPGLWRGRGLACLALGEWEKAGADFTQVLKRQPDDWEAYRGRGYARGELGGRWAAATADYSKALELKGGGASLWYLRGISWLFQREFAKAVVDYSRALEIDPAAAAAWKERAWAHEELHQWDNAAADYDRLVQLQKMDAWTWRRRGWTFLHLSRWDKAGANFLKADELSQAERNARWTWEYQCGPLMFLLAGDAAGYGTACQRLLGRFATTADPWVARDIAWVCCWGPDFGGEPQQLVQLAEKAVARRPDDHLDLAFLGSALYRAGRFNDAVQRLSAALKTRDQDHAGYVHLFLAMAQQRLGNAGEARRHLDQAIEVMKPAAGKAGIELAWQLRFEHLRREAEALLQGAAPIKK
jgi:serine/threonine-protein kinase